jgi:hypothetical protein
MGPEMLRQRAGHKNIYTTLDTYVHPSEEEVAEAFRKASEGLKMPFMEGSLVSNGNSNPRPIQAFDDKYSRMMEYLSSEGGTGLTKTSGNLEADSFRRLVSIQKKETGKLADFSGYQSERLKNEMKYFLLYSMKNGFMSVSSLYANYTVAIRQMGNLSSGRHQ